MKLFNEYVHGWMSRRDFLDGAAKFAVGGMTAAAMLEALKPNYAMAQQIAPSDSRIRVQYMVYPSPKGSGTMRGYMAMPSNVKGKLPGVVVIHENRGLNPYIEDVARRLATANFIAFAPDALAPVGGYPGNEESAAQMYRDLDANKRVEDMFAAIDVIKARPEFNGRYGGTGFCAGGGVVNLMAVRLPDMRAAVPFYGTAPNAADAAKIKAAVLAHYAADDANINPRIPDFEKGLKEGKVRYQLYTYPNTLHGFHNDSTPRYNKAAAELAWGRTVSFFNEHLRA
jgi:carboxymethylenebutenolidase